MNLIIVILYSNVLSFAGITTTSTTAAKIGVMPPFSEIDKQTDGEECVLQGFGYEQC